MEGFWRIFFVFVNMEPYGSENFKTQLLLQIAAERFQTFPELSSQWSSQNYVWYFWKLKFCRILFVFVNMGPNRRENFKALLLQIAAQSFQTRPEFSDEFLIQVCRKLPMSYQLQLSSRALRSIDLLFVNVLLRLHSMPFALLFKHLFWIHRPAVIRSQFYVTTITWPPEKLTAKTAD